MSNSVRPQRWQPTRLPRPWDSPGKNTGVGCHFLLQCRKVKSESEVAQLCLTLCYPIDGSPPGSPSLGFSRQEHWSGCHFLLQCMKVKSQSEVAQSCPTLSDLMDFILLKHFSWSFNLGNWTECGSSDLCYASFPLGKLCWGSFI